jgi:hypothetical protein
MDMAVTSCSVAQIHQRVYPEDGSSRFLRTLVDLYPTTRSHLTEDGNRIVIL